MYICIYTFLQIITKKIKCGTWVFASLSPDTPGRRLKQQPDRTMEKE